MLEDNHQVDDKLLIYVVIRTKLKQSCIVKTDTF